MPGLSFYHGSKFAVEGILETLGKEVAGLGIHVTAVEPGSFRTDWSGRSMTRTPRVIADYDELFEPLRARRIHGRGTQPGDPDKTAAAVLHIVAAHQPPTRACCSAPTHSGSSRPDATPSSATCRHGPNCQPPPTSTTPAGPPDATPSPHTGPLPAHPSRTRS
nr:SDR family NAD(P)-dependent oxidoreductase [Streptosporangium nondiastaticum]